MLCVAVFVTHVLCCYCRDSRILQLSTCFLVATVMSLFMYIHVVGRIWMPIFRREPPSLKCLQKYESWLQPQAALVSLSHTRSSYVPTSKCRGVAGKAATSPLCQCYPYLTCEFTESSFNSPLRDTEVSYLASFVQYSGVRCKRLTLDGQPLRIQMFSVRLAWLWILYPALRELLCVDLIFTELVF